MAKTGGFSPVFFLLLSLGICISISISLVSSASVSDSVDQDTKRGEAGAGADDDGVQLEEMEEIEGTEAKFMDCARTTAQVTFVYTRPSTRSTIKTGLPIGTDVVLNNNRYRGFFGINFPLTGFIRRSAVTIIGCSG